MTATPLERLIVKPAERRREVLRLIQAAHRRLWLSLFRCDDAAVLEAVAAAVRRGASVRVVMTGRAKGARRELERVDALLRRCGAEVRRYRDEAKHHAKYIVADDRALVGSLNYTRKCFVDTCDFMVVTDDRAVVAGLTELLAPTGPAAASMTGSRWATA